MALAAYRDVVRSPGVMPVLVLGFLARIPFSTLSLLFTLHAVYRLDKSYLEAGLIVTASTLGMAISSPWRGRLVDSRGLRRAVAPSIVVQSLTLVVAAFVPYGALVGLAFVGGLFSLPVFSIVRTSLAVLVSARMRRTAFALDSVITEVVFMIGPAAVAALAFTIGTPLLLIVVGVSVAVAGIGLVIADPPTRSDQVMLPTKLPGALQSIEDAALAHADGLGDKRLSEDLTTGAIPVVDPGTKASARRQLLTLGGIALLVATATSNVILTATDLGLVALLKQVGSENLVGLVITVWCVGSALGGIVYGAITREVNPLWVIGALGLLTIPIALAHSVPTIAIACFLAGLACAPSITATGEAISHRVPEEARGEAMGWHGSAMTIGGAVGGPVIGAVIDGWGPSWGIGSAGLLGVAIALGGLAAMRVHRTRVRARLARELGR
ncbi:MFS transporter [Brachybacterium huguangmaarense]|uniref:MFS transporter n=1 Tax=Brachybacterium huguangmaarense TaxID=1652028 RepID=A0ABY6FXE2_9MICO|nr:MFS transporter [Brachybacterium huguangmaarense]UYG15588.1 MFS transporter [Brachybacterium huguangmaarense]